MIESSGNMQGVLRLRKLAPQLDNTPASFTFRITSADGSTIIRDNIVLPSDGTLVTITNLAFGTYRLEEITDSTFFLAAATINGIPTQIETDPMTNNDYVLFDLVCGRDTTIVLFNAPPITADPCEDTLLRVRKIVGCLECMPELFTLRVLNETGTEVIFDNIAVVPNGDYVEVGRLLPGIYRVYEDEISGFKFASATYNGIDLTPIFDQVTNTYYVLIAVGTGATEVNLTICNRKQKNPCVDM